MPAFSDFFKYHRATSPLLVSAVFLVFFADSQTQLGFAHGVLFTPLVVLASLTGRLGLLHTISVLSICSLWLGYLVSPAAPEGFSGAYILANRLLATLAILLLWCLGLMAIKAQQQQKRQYLQEQQSKLDLNLASAVAALSHWYLNDHRKIVTLDEASRQLLGITAQELTLEQFICCFDEKSQRFIKQNLQLSVTQQKATTLETKLHQEAASPVWVKIVAYPDPNNPELIRGLLQNIEQNYQKASLLAEQQMRFMQLADSLPVKVWTATAEGIVDFASVTFANFCGRDTKTIVADWLDILHPDDRATTIEIWQHAVKTKTPYKVEFRILSKDGNYFWHLTSASPIFNDDGEVMYWFGSAMDISEQKALWLKADQLKQSLYQTLGSITDGFFTLDQDFRFTYLNQSAAELLAACKQPGPGKLLSEVCYVAGKDFSPLITAIQRSFYKQQTEQLSFTLPGTALPITFSVYPAAQGVSVLMQPLPASARIAAAVLP
ncbi:hypothetical protein GCM10010919_17430 [Alishewanella longhuensis]|uniref:histidine kinase n=1 Tax=Alishewanella longhuensis TaxID=1091037 RepID=A0ABQ3KXH2_9ALTE|nr:PAS domain-containing protein [Alishewanella longhuensis]GHG68180.1 hypothetical protein GCM10010919_17430 [Alishewanella longhuensis]